jgi:hypothetical protein
MSAGFGDSDVAPPRHRVYAVDLIHVDLVAGDPVGQRERAGKLLTCDRMALQAERRDGVAIDGGYRQGDKGAANAQYGRRRFDPHGAGLGDLGGDEAHRPLHQVDQRRIRCAVRVVNELVERQARVLVERERAAVGKCDRERRIAQRLDDVALEHEVADVELDGDAVAHHRRRAGRRFHPPDRLRRSRRSRLRILSGRGRAGQQLDEIGGKNRPFRRNEIGLLLLPEIIRNEDLAAVLPGQNQVGSFALEIGGAEEMGVGDVTTPLPGSTAIAAAPSRASKDSPRV